MRLGSFFFACLLGLAGCIQPENNLHIPLVINGSPSVEDEGDTVNILSDTFLNAHVSGLGYATESQLRATDSLGRLNYADNETVIFSIGDLALSHSIAYFHL